MLKTSTFKIQVNCPGCNTYHAVSGVNDFEKCEKCGKGIALSTLFDETLMGNTVDKLKYLNMFLAGTIQQLGGGGVGQTGSYKLSYSSGHAYCEECLTFIEENEITGAIRDKRPVSCGKCSHKMPLQLPTDAMKRFHPKAIAVINDPQGIDSGVAKGDGVKMLVYSCMTCGAGLNLTDKTQRTLKCEYCNNDNYLPDSIWMKLHPDEDVQPFFLITDISEQDLVEGMNYFLNVTMMRVYQKHIDNFTTEMFQNMKVTDALKAWVGVLLNAKFDDKIGYNMDITKSQKYFYEQFGLGLDNQDTELKKYVAANSTTLPVEIQEKLANDKNDEVRSALADNGSLEKDIYKILKNDPNEMISKAAGKHKIGLFSKLFG